MHFIKTLFRKQIKDDKVSNTKSIVSDSNISKTMFLLGWEVILNGERHCNDFIKTQRTTEICAKNHFSSLELIFINNKLTEAYELDDRIRQIKELKDNETGLVYQDYPVNQILKFVDNPNGPHQLGGEKSENITFPENNCKVQFQYLGFISNKPENMNWLPSTIHLMCPIFLNIDKVFLDYSNPECPKLINREELESIETEYDDLNEDSEIIYQSRKFDLIEFDEIKPPLSAGVPNWIQYPDIPHCPKSGKTMKFLCQIEKGVDTQRSNVNPKEEFYKRYFDTLNFWGDGDMFVFIEPNEKTVCYFIQHT